jgi:hypothetical protein
MIANYFVLFTFIKKKTQQYIHVLVGYHFGVLLLLLMHNHTHHEYFIFLFLFLFLSQEYMFDLLALTKENYLIPM